VALPGPWGDGMRRPKVTAYDRASHDNWGNSAIRGSCSFFRHASEVADLRSDDQRPVSAPKPTARTSIRSKTPRFFDAGQG
jgi:hypothetical protein